MKDGQDQDKIHDSLQQQQSETSDCSESPHRATAGADSPKRRNLTFEEAWELLAPYREERRLKEERREREEAE